MQVAQLKATIKGLFLAFGVAGLVSCGSGDEAGGGGSCGGADESGICLQVNLIEPVHLDGAISLAVDVDAIADCIAGLPLDPEMSVGELLANGSIEVHVVGVEGSKVQLGIQTRPGGARR